MTTTTHTTLTGTEDISTVTLETLKGVTCAPEDREAVKELLNAAAAKLTESDVCRAVAARGPNDEAYRVFIGFNSEASIADRRAAEKKIYG